MWTKQKRQTKIKRIFFYMGTVLLAGYYFYHCYGGAYGLQAYGAEEKKIAVLEHRLNSLLKEHAELAHKVSLLQEPHINKDSLEEYARRDLNMTAPNELVVLTN